MLAKRREGGLRHIVVLLYACFTVGFVVTIGVFLWLFQVIIIAITVWSPTGLVIIITIITLVIMKIIISIAVWQPDLHWRRLPLLQEEIQFQR